MLGRPGSALFATRTPRPDEATLYQVGNADGSPGRAGVDSADLSFAEAMDAFRRADRRLGAAQVYPHVLRYLRSDVAPVLFDACEADAQSAFRAAVVLTDMAGWMAHDLGRDDLAGAHFAKALAFARSVPDATLSANVLAAMSHLALEGDRPGEAADLAASALTMLDTKERPPALSARLLAMRARALARGRDRAGAYGAMAEARRELGRTQAGPPPWWVAPFDEGALAGETALMLRDLRLFGAADLEAQRAVRLRDRQPGRGHAFGTIRLARILVDRREPERASAVGSDILDSCLTIGSVRITRDLTGLARSLDSYRDLRVVAEFRDGVARVNRQRGRLLRPLLPAVAPAGPRP
ncbi:hypothetical protein B4N89_45855 [Embleya scabrispora]|uniref:Transcriptional regulator n=2 Tax=Embleya scabrispora TaxID=159449 RepID=A0A1T3NJ28_9ACTN|nr:hypothetical protein B4N89_45855 [Embleya scabrispora]